MRDCAARRLPLGKSASSEAAARSAAEPGAADCCRSPSPSPCSPAASSLRCLLNCFRSGRRSVLPPAPFPFFLSLRGGAIAASALTSSIARRCHAGPLRLYALTASPSTPVTRRGLPSRRPRRSPSATQSGVAAVQVMMNEAAASARCSFLGIRVLIKVMGWARVLKSCGLGV